ncbi:type 1 glutamine amidotransferase [Methanolobus bombayensis]|uniref:type 1 glutamine amidotransferase n=1 Tax=Methanolobus bombayensis TaxID=38023 RepID=UPI001AE175B7|nr:type 1 glutamine amidotransferase [Methanolobus bombayensis]MBP1909975.1 GMP synthase-like glutamine amidotransferase [Methanolobus bombayensis]
MSLLIVKNITREGPGILENILKDNNISYHIADLDGGDGMPEADEYNGIIVLGGPDSANDQTEKIQRELAMIKKAIDLKIPYLGICLGMQMLARSQGITVYENNVREIGFRSEDGEYYSVDIKKEHVNDPLLNGLANPVKIFHLHGETVDLNDDIDLLATGKYCQNQIIKVGSNAYGIQGHFELTPEMFKVWLDNDPEIVELDRDMLLGDFEKIAVEYGNNGKILFTNFLKIAGLL